MKLKNKRKGMSKAGTWKTLVGKEEEKAKEVKEEQTKAITETHLQDCIFFVTEFWKVF